MFSQSRSEASSLPSALASQVRCHLLSEGFSGHLTCHCTPTPTLSSSLPFSFCCHHIKHTIHFILYIVPRVVLFMGSQEELSSLALRAGHSASLGKSFFSEWLMGGWLDGQGLWCLWEGTAAHALGPQGNGNFPPCLSGFLYSRFSDVNFSQSGGTIRLNGDICGAL